MLIREFRELAPVGAIVKADQLRAAGDEAGRAVRRRVKRAAEELLDTDAAKPGTTPH